MKSYSKKVLHIKKNDISISFIDLDVIDFSFKQFVFNVVKHLNIAKGSIDIQFVSKQFIQNMHTKYLNNPNVTDVISFNLGDQSNLMADIYICVYQAKKNASLYQVTLINELKRLIVHGLLHCMGYNDIKETERKVMIDLQENILSECDS